MSADIVGLRKYRLYGDKPYTVVVLHGGPGTPGSMGRVAEKISRKFGVIEPFQTAGTINGQIQELKAVIDSECHVPSVKLVGHSYGAWLAFIFAATFPELVDKLILIGAGAFAEKYNASLAPIRLGRLSRDDRVEVVSLTRLLNSTPTGDSSAPAFRRYGELMSKADSYDPIDTDDGILAFQPDMYRSIWREAEKMRRDGGLLKLADKIRCPVVAIHGDYDPHPAEGVREPLAGILKDFRFMLLRECGHYPWNERRAREEFFHIMNNELSTTGIE